MSLKGIVLITRHGDRMGFYQSPTTYTATETNLTVLGYLQEYQNGVDLRAMYLDNSAATPNIAAGSETLIEGINATQSENTQIRVMADGAGEGTVIVDSTNALLQGLYPPYNDAITLANGSVVSWDRTQLIEVQTIEPDQETWLEGWTDCKAWQKRLNQWYDSDEFKAQAAVANPFFASLKNVLGNRPATLENAWNLFDYLNVESIHNASIASQVSAAQLQQAAYWADYHESGSFSDVDSSNIGNIGGQAFLAPLLSAVQDVSNSSNPLKLGYLSASYKPFLSLFSMWDLPSEVSDNVVSYASAAVLEVRNNDTIRLVFRNGTAGAFEPYGILGRDAMQGISVDDFVSAMQPLSLPTLADWCDKCQTTDARGCSVLAQLNGTGGAGYASIDSTTGRHRVSPVVAGVIGAMVTLAVVAFCLGTWLLLGGMVQKHKRTRTTRHGDAASLQSSSGSTRQGSHQDQKG